MTNSIATVSKRWRLLFIVSVKQQCQVCGGESFTTSHGLKVCDQCGRQEEHYIELLSQETIGEVDRSRLITAHLQEHEGEEAARPHSNDEKLNNWTTYEAYNFILYEWTKALLKLGASPKVETITFKLWVAYLQRIGIAFTQERKSSCLSTLKNNRDMKIIHERAESVSSRSLYSYSRHTKKKRKAAPTKLDKIRSKIERKKLKNAVKNQHDSSFMNTTLASELSKSLNEFEASMISDSCTSYTSSHAGDSKLDISVKSEVTSTVSGTSHVGPSESGSEVEGADIPFVPRKQIRRDSVVMNWIKRATHIYASESEEEKQCQGNGVEKVESEKMEEEDSDDDDHSSEITPKKKQNTTKKPIRTYKCKKYKYNELYRKAVRASSELTSYRASRLPFIMRFPKLLGILYLAVLLAKEDILLSDIIRWCREGHIPYFSAPYLLRPDMDVSYYDLIMLRSCKKVPDAQEVQAIAGRLAVFLNIQYVPLPPMKGILRKYVKLLNLPDHVATVAESLVEVVSDMKTGLSVPPVESMAMASIILTLKLYCGLDSHTEVMLSHAAAAISAKLPSHTSITPFSWLDWQKHISRLLWVCCQVDPPTAFHWQQLHDISNFSSTIYSMFFWREDMWRVPRTSCKKKAELQILTEELLQHQGLSLEEVIMQPPLFQASQQPLRSTIEQLVHGDSTTKTKEMHKYIKVAEELMEESFASHNLNWFCKVDCIATELRKCGSEVQHLFTEGEEKAGILCRIQTYDDNDSAQGNKKKRTNTTQELFIPYPLKYAWKIKQKTHATWEKLSPLMPSSFKWLVGIGSQICEAPKMQLLLLVCLLQNKIKKRP